ncbi:MAG: hypothetical protein KAK00_00370 [Nanoarchaeota archaeon]|nr:hypothetical protein [Nanoarchaeota archaeon]
MVVGNNYRKRRGLIKIDNIHDESITVSKGMLKYGGSFIRSIGESLNHADDNNKQKIKDTWPEEWNKYPELGLCIEFEDRE